MSRPGSIGAREKRSSMIEKRPTLKREGRRDRSSVGSRGAGNAATSPHPPTLLKAYRSQMVSAGKVASFPWLVVLLIGLAVSILLAFVATGHMINLHRLGIILGLNE